MPSSRTGRLPVSSVLAWLGRKFLYGPFRHLVEWGPWDYSGTAVVWCGCVGPIPSLSLYLHSSFHPSFSILPPLPLSICVLWAHAGLELWQSSCLRPSSPGASDALSKSRVCVYSVPLGGACFDSSIHYRCILHHEAQRAAGQALN